MLGDLSRSDFRLDHHPFHDPIRDRFIDFSFLGSFLGNFLSNFLGSLALIIVRYAEYQSPPFVFAKALTLLSRLLGLLLSTISFFSKKVVSPTFDSSKTDLTSDT